MCLDTTRYKWDVCMMSALLFTALVTPYEIALLPTMLNGLFFINRCRALKEGRGRQLLRITHHHALQSEKRLNIVHDQPHKFINLSSITNLLVAIRWSHCGFAKLRRSERLFGPIV